MDLIEILLGVGCLFLLLIFLQLGSIEKTLKGISIYQEVIGHHSDLSDKVREEMLAELREFRESQLLLPSDVAEIKYVTDVMYKYKLPNKKERELLDRIAIDEEVFDGIARAGRNDEE